VLNDCINRTLEALNQVRLSVYGAGLQHTAGIGVNPFVSTPFAANPVATMGINPFGVTGLGHTAAAYYPQLDPIGANPFAQYNPFATMSAIGGGLGHTALDPRIGYDWTGTDPYGQTRISQTFPFVHWGYSPFGWPNV